MSQKADTTKRDKSVIWTAGRLLSWNSCLTAVLVEIRHRHKSESSWAWFSWWNQACNRPPCPRESPRSWSTTLSPSQSRTEWKCWREVNVTRYRACRQKASNYFTPVDLLFWFEFITKRRDDSVRRMDHAGQHTSDVPYRSTGRANSSRTRPSSTKKVLYQM